MRTHVQRGRAFENLQRGCFESDSSEEHEGVVLSQISRAGSGSTPACSFLANIRNSSFSQAGNLIL